MGRCLGATLVAVLLGLGIALPLLDRQEGSATPVFEREHDQGTRTVGHDHRICVLGGTLRMLPSAPAPRERVHAAAVRASVPRGATAIATGPVSHHHSRAPPVRV